MVETTVKPEAPDESENELTKDDDVMRITFGNNNRSSNMSVVGDPVLKEDDLQNLLRMEIVADNVKLNLIQVRR